VHSQSVLAANTNIKRNLLDRSLNSHTLGPGQSASGFIYVRVPHGELNGCTLSLASHEVGAAVEQPILLDVSLPWSVKARARRATSSLHSPKPSCASIA
jgi:hypothetical protein